MEKLLQDLRTPYEIFCDMPEDVRCELINDKIVMMGAPSIEHQRICGELFGQLWLHLRGKRCQVFMDVCVRFKEVEPINNALRPDITVVCDPDKIRKEGVVGAPDLIIEVVSPSSFSYDSITKLALYQNEGVREYWIVDHERNTVYTFLLNNGNYNVKTYHIHERIPVMVLDDFAIDLHELYEQPLNND